MTVKNSRTESLVKDVAQLFVTYPSSVWQPFVEELAKGSDMQKRISTAVSAILSEIPSGIKQSPQARKRKASIRKTLAKKTSKPTPLEHEPEFEFSPGRSTELSILRDDLALKRVLPRISDLRQLYLEVGGKDEFPKDRKKASQYLLVHLNGVSDEAFSLAIKAIQESFNGGDAADAYARWFKLIRPLESGHSSQHRPHAIQVPVEKKDGN